LFSLASVYLIAAAESPSIEPKELSELHKKIISKIDEPTHPGKILKKMTPELEKEISRKVKEVALEIEGEGEKKEEISEDFKKIKGKKDFAEKSEQEAEEDLKKMKKEEGLDE